MGREGTQTLTPRADTKFRQPRWSRTMSGSNGGFDPDLVRDYLAKLPVIGGRSLRVTMPGGAATTAGTALVTGMAV